MAISVRVESAPNFTMKEPQEPTKAVFLSDTEDDDDDEAQDEDDREQAERARLAGFLRGWPARPTACEDAPVLTQGTTCCYSQALLRAIACNVHGLPGQRYLHRYRAFLRRLPLPPHRDIPGKPNRLLASVLAGSGHGIWIIGHECGHHQTFSVYRWVNDLVGLVVHSALLTPYFSWKITHRHHHSSIGSIEHDAVFVPMIRTEYKTWREAVFENLEDSPLFNLCRIIVMLAIGWMLAYLVFNAAKHEVQPVSHFNPNAVLFTNRERHLVVISNVGVGVLTWWLSPALMAKLYFAPFIIVNALIVIQTLLQHTDILVPRFRSESWTWLHGALCTVDRDFGVFLNDALHHGPDTHVCHHILSKIPFYHVVEATRALRPLLGRYYLKDDTPIAKAFWRCYTHCKFVEDDGSVVFRK